MNCSDRVLRGSARWIVAAAALLFAAAPVANSSSAGERRLTTDGRLKMDPVVVPAAGGWDVVYTVLESPVQTSLMRLSLADGSQRRMNPDAATSEFEPAFSPDGRYCAFVQSRGNLSLKLIIRDTLEKRDASFDPGGGFAGMRRPSISPDARRVVFSLPAGGGQQIVSTDLEGKDRRDLTRGESLNHWPAFSPDGRQIAFGSSRDGDYDLYIMNADGGDVRRVVQHTGRDMRPAWSPDGSRLAFSSGRDQNMEIYVVGLDGSGLLRVTDHPEQDDYPAWRPDGKQLITVSERSGQFDLYAVDVPDR